MRKYSCNYLLLAVSTLAPQRVALFVLFVAFADFTWATYLSALKEFELDPIQI